MGQDVGKTKKPLPSDKHNWAGNTVKWAQSAWRKATIKLK